MAGRTIETNLKLTGEKEFNQQMKALNNGLKTTKSDMAALSAEFDDNANSMKALTAKNKLLQASVDQHQAKVDALRKQYEAAAATLGEDAAATQRYKQQLNQATVALQKETKALEENSDAMRKKYLAGLQMLSSGAKSTMQGIGKIAGGAAKGIGVISAASVAGVAALAAGGVMLLTKMATFAKEAADAAKAASEAGEPLTEQQQKWLEFSNQLDSLDASVQSAKEALGNVLLPALSELAGEGASFLTDFSRDLDAAAGDAEKQGEVISQYIVRLAQSLIAEAPEFAKAAKGLIAGLGSGLSESGPELMEDVFSLLMDVLNSILDFAPELAMCAVDLIEQLAQGLTDQGPELVQSAVEMVSQIVLGLAQAAPDLIPAAVSLVAQLAVALIASAPDLLLAGLELVYGVIQGIANAGGELINSADGMIETIKTAFVDKADDFLEIGQKIIDYIRNGIEIGWDYLTDWFTKLWDDLFGNLDLNVNVVGGETVVTNGSIPGYYSGLDYVPFDDYIARLHKGEMVLNHTEAEAYRKNRTREVVQRVINLYFYAKSISEEDIDMVVDIVNRKLGEDM